jgi:hypothetical protein
MQQKMLRFSPTASQLMPADLAACLMLVAAMMPNGF